MNTSVTLVFIERIIMAIVDNPYYVVLKSDLVIRGTFTKRKTIINDMSYYASLNIPNYVTITEIPEEHSPSGLDTSNAQNWTHAFDGMREANIYNPDVPWYDMNKATDCSFIFRLVLDSDVSQLTFPNTVTNMRGAFAASSINTYPQPLPISVTDASMLLQGCRNIEYGNFPIDERHTNLVNIDDIFSGGVIYNSNVNITIPSNVVNATNCFMEIRAGNNINIFVKSDKIQYMNNFIQSSSISIPPGPDTEITPDEQFNELRGFVHINYPSTTYNAHHISSGWDLISPCGYYGYIIHCTSMRNAASNMIPDYKNITTLEAVDATYMFHNGSFDNRFIKTETVTDWSNAFAEMSNLVSLPVNHPLNFSAATNMRCMFKNCTKLVEGINIPTNVIDCAQMYVDCHNMINAPTILSNKIINMRNTFWNCYNMTSIPKIPDSVTEFYDTFFRCYNITDTPKIPNSAINIVGAFHYCYNITETPVIPNSVLNMWGTFADCRNLSNMPTIPENVTNIRNTFYNCANIRGDCDIVSNNITNAENVVRGSTTYDKYFYVNQGTASWNSIYAGIGNTTYNATTKTHLIPFKSKYNVTFSQPSNGSITVNDSSSSISVNRNTTITIKVTPNANYKLSKLLVNNVDIYNSGNTSNTYTFIVKEDTSISVTFEEKGTVLVNGNYTVEKFIIIYRIILANKFLMQCNSEGSLARIVIHPYQNKSTINIKLFINNNEYSATLTWNGDVYETYDCPFLFSYFNSGTEGKTYNIKIIILP